MAFLRAIEDRLVRIERGLLATLLLFMVALSFLQVVLRIGFSTGILWGDTLNRHLVLWLGFFGASVAAARDRQFAMDLSARYFTGRTRHAVLALCHAFALAVCVLFVQASTGFFREEYAHPAVLFTLGRSEIPVWIFELILPGGFAMLAFHYLLKTLTTLGALSGPTGPG